MACLAVRFLENRAPFPDIGRNMEKTPVVASLQREQASALVLYLNYKKYHWLTFGPHFRDMHLLFEDHGNQVLASIDEFAERALMIDGRPLADPAQYLPASFVTPSAGERTVKQMVEEAIGSHDKV